MNCRAQLNRIQNTLYIKGILDFSSVPLIWKKGEHLIKECHLSTIDFSGVKFSNSAGLALLIEWLKFANHNKQKINLQHLPAQLLAIAKASGIMELLVPYLPE